ncbi:MAG: PLP-dependent lyase/thiolase [Candidatus Dormibacteria bacterium]
MADSKGVAPRLLGQWVHAQIFGASLPAGARLTLGEGGTALDPTPELGEGLGIPQLLLKREDQNPTGSHKARCLSLLCSQVVASGRSQAVISSSGNAAVAAAAYAELGGIRLLSLISPLTPRVKLERLLAYPQLAVASPRPVGLLHHSVRHWQLQDLRGSTNPLAPNAYRGIAAELVGGDELAAIFLYASSGASALGLAQGLERLLERSQRPQLHIVETAPGGELTRPWYPRGTPDDGAGPRVGELGARRSRLAPAVRRAVRASGGRGWRVAPSELPQVRELAERSGLRTSWEGLATLAAMRRAAAEGWPVRAATWIAVMTGDAAQLDLEPGPAAGSGPPIANSEEELDQLLREAGFSRGQG